MRNFKTKVILNKVLKVAKKNDISLNIEELMVDEHFEHNLSNNNDTSIYIKYSTIDALKPIELQFDFVNQGNLNEQELKESQIVSKLEQSLNKDNKTNVFFKLINKSLKGLITLKDVKFKKYKKNSTNGVRQKGFNF